MLPDSWMNSRRALSKAAPVRTHGHNRRLRQGYAFKATSL
jgi:hypothetical protein